MILRNHCNRRRVILLLITTGLIQHILCYTVEDANKLQTDLFTKYNKYVIPHYPVTVNAEYNLLTINAVDMKCQTVSTSGWFTVIWTDNRLSWTQSSYGYIDHIYVAETMLWYPTLIVENSITDLTSLGDDNTQVRIRYDGQVRWEPSAILTTSCDMDITYFPFDIQSCDIQLASWGFHTEAVLLTLNTASINLQDYTTNGEWNLISTSQNISEITDDGLMYRSLSFRLMLERLPGHYIMSVIFPVVLISILTLVTFLLPVDCGEKVSYILTVLTALTVLLTMFSDNMPTTSKHTAILVVFLSMTLGFASIVIIITILVIRLYHKPYDHTAFLWMYRLFKKCKGRDVRVQPVVPQSKTEDGTGSKFKHALKNKDSLDESEQFQTCSNQDLAQFFYNFFFIVFVTLYITVGVGFIATLDVGQ